MLIDFAKLERMFTELKSTFKETAMQFDKSVTEMVKNRESLDDNTVALNSLRASIDANTKALGGDPPRSRR